MKKAQPPRFSSDHQRRARELLAKYAAEPADERPFVEDDTEVRREQIWAAWEGYVVDCHLRTRSRWSYANGSLRAQLLWHQPGGWRGSRCLPVVGGFCP